MKDHSPTPTITRPSSIEGFTALDEIYNRGIASHDLARFGMYCIVDTVILKTPAAVTERGYVLTNPSTIETVGLNVGGETVKQDFAYCRYEPAGMHIGHTESLPYFIRKDRNGQPYLDEFTDAMVLPGEDPRVTRDVKIRGLAGKIHNGWLVSTTVATPVKNDPAYVESIKQVFYWGETLGKMDEIAVLPGAKNTTLCPAGGTALHALARLNKPHTSYVLLPDITYLTRERIEAEGVNITDELLPEGVYGGPNSAKGAGIGYLALNSHEAYVKPLPPDGKWDLNYRAVRNGLEIPRPDLPKGRLIPIEVIAIRSQFPDAPAKLPQDGVASYRNIVYGGISEVDHRVAVGSVAGHSLFGLSDSTVGYAKVKRRA